MNRFLFLAAAVPLAACGQPASTAASQPNGNAAAPAAGGYIAKVEALAPREREGVLYRAITKGGGQACQGVDKVEQLPPTKAGQPNWRATCTDGSQWLVTLSDDGTALVTGARTP